MVTRVGGELQVTVELQVVGELQVAGELQAAEGGKMEGDLRFVCGGCITTCIYFVLERLQQAQERPRRRRKRELRRTCAKFSLSQSLLLLLSCPQAPYTVSTPLFRTDAGCPTSTRNGAACWGVGDISGISAEPETVLAFPRALAAAPVQRRVRRYHLMLRDQLIGLNAEVVKLLFKNPNQTERTCFICDIVVKQLKSAGYKNLMTHLRSHHVGFEAVAEKCANKGCSPIRSMFVHKNVADTYGWTKLVALKNFRLAHIDDAFIPFAIRYKAMDRATLLKRITSLVGVVECKISVELAGEKFELVFDGFTDSAEHAIAIFAATKKGVRFLAFSPFQNEASMTAAEHIDFLDLVLPQYGPHIANTLTIFTDNMPTNKTIARRVDVPLVGCAAHCFNHAIRGRLAPHMKQIKGECHDAEAENGETDR
ncbi:unnamed protein product [Phytophthora fragariaefolia]|uniref:Unnamed protein product n=1 Tax=Phytophthora fragariaefolia TaxID=1490495 RepID=A0A9W6XIY3_9STRA|nr:unnamed protein product [Phytophthora fragariaefolia]